MAFFATHVRFALDVQDACQVSDVRQYLSGTAYPDSRYVTHVDRMATHPERWNDPTFIDDPFFWESDFRKGWFIHLLCDNQQYRAMREMFPDIRDGSSEDTWVKRTALKFLQDMQDAQEDDVRTHLSALSLTELPNGEKHAVMAEYYDCIKRTYGEHIGIDSAAYVRAIGRDLTFDSTLLEQVVAQCEQYRRDRSVMHTLGLLYPMMVEGGKRTLASSLNGIARV